MLLTCEHATNAVPPELGARFRGARSVLASHRGWDLGALGLARRLARELGAPIVVGEVSRLVIDLNRSRGHPRLFSEFTKPLPPAERERLRATWWAPHRERVERALARLARGGRSVAHVGVHSFTPVLDGDEREVDVGLLYDPARAPERELCRSWKRALRARWPELVVRANQPYRGTSDGLTTDLRRGRAARRYLGIELEVSQAIVLGPRARWRALQRALAASLAEALRGSR